MKRFRSVLEHLHRAPGMWLWEESFSSVCAFVDGYNTAVECGVLVGFREWLATRLEFGSNLAWSALVVHTALPGPGSAHDRLRDTPDGDRLAIDKFHELFQEFDEIRSRPDGLMKIFAAYEKQFHGAVRAPSRRS